MNEQLERSGRVVGFKGAAALVRIDGPAACGGCGSRGGCASAGGTRVVELELPAGAQLGDAVSLSAPSASVARAALLGYLLPAACLVAGASLAAIEGNDTSAALGALAGLTAGLLLVRLISHSAGAHRMSLSRHADVHPGECS